MSECQVIAFPLHRVRLPDEDELWCRAVEQAIKGKGLTVRQVHTVLCRVDYWRKAHPEGQPGSAPWAEFTDFTWETA